MRSVGFFAAMLLAVVASEVTLLDFVDKQTDGNTLNVPNENTTITVDCDERNAIVTVVNNKVSYKCENNKNGDGDPKDMQEGIQKIELLSNLTLEINGGGDKPKILYFTGNDTSSPTITLNGDTLNLAALYNLQTLKFNHVVFEKEVKLDIPLSLTTISFLDTKMTDFSITNYNNAVNLTKIEITDTAFSVIPKFLYEYEYSNTTDITLDWSSVAENTNTSMTPIQYEFLKANVVERNGKTANNNVSCRFLPLEAIGNEGVANCNVEDSSSDSSSSSVASSDASNSSASDSTPTESTEGDSSGVSTGALVAIIVVVVAVALVLAFFILRMHFKRKAANVNSHCEATTTLMSKGDATAEKGSFISNDEFLRNFRLPQSDVSLVKSVGTGRLWMGEYNSEKVIIKRVESEVTDSFVTKALMAQARSFATISHPNITNLVGVTWLAGTDFAVVTEFMDKGNLKTVLSNTDIDLNVSTKLQMCLDVAQALAYLHETERNLCAKKLSSRKVLVNSALSCKLSLFTCVPSSTKLGGSGTFSYGMGEVAWLAPEIITRSSPMDARKNNMFAFGVLISEIFTRVSPYQTLIEEKGNTLSDVELVNRVRRQEPLKPHENRPGFLEAPASVRQLVEQCLLYAPMSRPTAKDLVDVLHRAKEAANAI